MAKIIHAADYRSTAERGYPVKGNAAGEATLCGKPLEEGKFTYPYFDSGRKARISCKACLKVAKKIGWWEDDTDAARLEKHFQACEAFAKAAERRH